jgi:rhodanese-related sulfurtransferase
MASKISPKELRNILRSAETMAVLDVRSPAEFAIGHVPGAVNIPMEQVERRMADVPSAPLVLVCEAGKRAEIVSGWLGEKGEIRVLEGGTREWRNAGYPLVACSPCRWTLERQVRLIAGMLVLLGSVLAVLVHTRWVYLAMFIGAGLTFAGATNICALAVLLAKMPWNSRGRASVSGSTPAAENCCT